MNRHMMAIILALVANHVAGHSRGAPHTACDSMYPLHKHNAETSSCPFEAHPYEAEISSDSSLKIALRSLSLTEPSDTLLGSSSSSESSYDYFKGYMIMAFQKNVDNVAIGTFQVNDDSHTIDCHGMIQNAATHSSKSHKSIVHVTWSPPENFEGDVVFKTTFVASKKIFWVKQLSAPVHVKSATRQKTNLTQLLQSERDEPSFKVMTYLEENQYAGLWAVSLFILGFSCAALAKLILSSRSKKYVPIVSL